MPDERTVGRSFMGGEKKARGQRQACHKNFSLTSGVKEGKRTSVVWGNMLR